ncbi:FLYWCH family member 2 isoform X1 [Pipistrellus kuhlii]|uniref:FLYWCH family member 2 isoform X1 n=1 Tax=Pipistrellus kuhlii TaxID=59472 RepID=UPI001E272BA7|nr:FLYWCH family member 2 isoform X1 [Pipistrellus kuhlii]XP_045427350.1 FLYWCH family member 2 isoform X1 [Pipistrellus kuhlii]XP_045427351.1 FLYWCH family member 2 isoform X1 [Pipistrellus kuhlii]XP_045427352.1 FLYWCH family member 2 isoform X1 [Pipistrellus kuhlii]
MPLPEPSEQEGESVKAGQEPRPQGPEPGTDVVPTAAPKKPRKFSKLVLLTASKDSDKVAAAKRRGVHCIMSLGVPGPTTLAKALLTIHPEPQRAIEAAPQEPEQKRRKLDAGSLAGTAAGQQPPQLPSHLLPLWLHPWPGPGHSISFLLLSPDLAPSFLEVTLAASVAFGSVCLQLTMF